mmetsp:Transcript_36668/g.86753  ORF Transcript_36668/g.86753 Transcript_36668/m.86753 type:complete len:321 (-) Transcript_36668:1092-2054(-)
MTGTRWPSSCCCPRRQQICDMLTLDPLAPVAVIISKLFSGNGTIWPVGRMESITPLVTDASACWMRPSLSLRPFSSCSKCASALCTAFRRRSSSRPFTLEQSSPNSISAKLAEELSVRQLEVASTSRRFWSASGVTMRSRTPHVNARWTCMKCVKRRPKMVSSSPALCGPCASNTACTRPLADAPIWLLSSTPLSMSFPRTINVPSWVCWLYMLPFTLHAPLMFSGGSPWSRLCRIVVIICLPVQSGTGFQMVGGTVLMVLLGSSRSAARFAKQRKTSSWYSSRRKKRLSWHSCTPPMIWSWINPRTGLPSVGTMYCWSV